MNRTVRLEQFRLFRQMAYLAVDSGPTSILFTKVFIATHGGLGHPVLQWLFRNHPEGET